MIRWDQTSQALVERFSEVLGAFSPVLSRTGWLKCVLKYTSYLLCAVLGAGRGGANTVTHACKASATTKIRTCTQRAATCAPAPSVAQRNATQRNAGFNPQFPHFCKRKIFACVLLNSLEIVIRANEPCNCDPGL